MDYACGCSLGNIRESSRGQQQPRPESKRASITPGGLEISGVTKGRGVRAGSDLFILESVHFGGRMRGRGYPRVATRPISLVRPAFLWGSSRSPVGILEILSCHGAVASAVSRGRAWLGEHRHPGSESGLNGWLEVAVWAHLNISSFNSGASGC